MDSKKQARLEKTGYIVSIALIVVCLIGITASSMWRLSEIRKQTTKLEEELAVWEAKLSELELAIKEATKDETIERIAREKLGLVMPGETVYIPKQVETP